MRIAFDMVVVEQEQGEAQQATCILLHELAMLGTHQYIIITGRPGLYRKQKQAANIYLYPVKIGVGRGVLTWHQLLLPTILRRLQPDILHVPNSIAPIGWNGPLIVSIYDLAYEQPGDAQKHVLLYKQHMLHESMERAQGIIIPSEQIAERISIMLNRMQSEAEKRVHRIESKTQAHVVLRAYHEALRQNHSGIDAIERTRAKKDADEIYNETLLIDSFLEDAAYPIVSIIIPASRSEQAEQTLKALSQQSYVGQLEIIMVGPPARQLAQRWPIRAVHPEAIYTPGKARNLGAAQANGDILLFLDDDMLVAANWVEQNVLALQQDSVGAVGARMPGKTQTFYARCADFTNYGYYQHTHAMQELLGAGSMGIDKKFFAELGGFDEELRSGEDVELCYRIQKQGYCTLYQPEIVVVHDHHYDTLNKLLRYNYTHGLQAGLVTKIGPGDEEKLRARVIASSIRYPPLFLLLLPLLALWGAIRIVSLNISDHNCILLYFPYIFLGKLAYQIGVFMHLLLMRKVKKCDEEGSGTTGHI